MANFGHEQVAGLDDRFFVTIDNRYELSITEAHITDLIADLLHMAARNLADDSEDESLDVDAVADRVLRVARLHFDAEHGNPEEEGAAARAHRT